MPDRTPLRLEGRARLFGDDINTDYIITSVRKRETLDVTVLRHHLLETVDPAFAASVQSGDFLVAGRNFGCGSAMEIAATVILAARIPAVIARSFSRTFYRNAVNNGLLPVECDTRGMREGQRIALDLGAVRIDVTDLETGARRAGIPLPDIMQRILAAGGLVPFVRAGAHWNVG